MTQRFYYTAICILLVLLMGLDVNAASLFEQYANKSKSDLEAETTAMGKELKNTFNEKSVNKYQQKIDFADYFANFKKLVLYGGKLGNYGNYEKDLSFAKDNETFKGLPDAKAGVAVDRKEFIEEKFGKMKVNVEDEIATYVDLIQISLDACEIMASNDLSGFMDDEDNRDKISDFLTKGKSFQDFEDRQKSLQTGWPNLAARIIYQIDKWKAPPKDMDAPLIDRAITGAL